MRFTSCSSLLAQASNRIFPDLTHEETGFFKYELGMTRFFKKQKSRAAKAALLFYLMVNYAVLNAAFCRGHHDLKNVRE